MYNPTMNKIDFEWDDNKMREEYDLSQMKSRPNPYAKHLKRKIFIKLLFVRLLCVTEDKEESNI